MRAAPASPVGRPARTADHPDRPLRIALRIGRVFGTQACAEDNDRKKEPALELDDRLLFIPVNFFCRLRPIFSRASQH